MRLLEVFKDFRVEAFDPVTLRPIRIVPKKKILRVRDSTLLEAVEWAKKKDPLHVYRVVERHFRGQKFIVIEKVDKPTGDFPLSKTKVLSLYYNKKEGKWFVNSSQARNSKRLLMNFVWQRLNDMGLVLYPRTKHSKIL
jgi:hypothetical protein